MMCNIRGCFEAAIGTAVIRGEERIICEHHSMIYKAKVVPFPPPPDPRSIYEKERPGMTRSQWARRRRQLKRQGIDYHKRGE